MKLALSPTPRACALAVVLAWLAPRSGRAENSISYKYEDYQESGARIGVRTQGAYAQQDFGPDTHLKLEGVLDAITGATPDGRPAPAGSDQVPLTEMHDRRKAWNADLSHEFPGVTLDFGAGNSRESDYISNGWSFNTITDFNQKNTELLAGIAGTDDKIKVLYSSVAPRQRKHTNDLILGVTQLIDPNTSFTANVSWGRQSGYLSDPYKLVQKTVEVFAGAFLPFTYSENRPDYREKWVVLLELNHAFPAVNGTVDASYRYYHDTFGTDAHTVDLAWFQRIGQRLILRPSFRYYTQTGAVFYHYNLDATSILPTGGAPNPAGPFYSSDYRLSALNSYTYGVKLIWNATQALAFDAALEEYRMRGRDGITPQSAYPSARIITVGAKFAW
ncbi:MAG TPA: DUF3570 domain-containing protein [Opitutaceae bacterium]|nr:DUF3570 domain-containing protein [Opitutaceae bacterium]